MSQFLGIGFVAAVAILCALPALAAPNAIDLQHSRMTVYVFKQGLFSVFADNHEIYAPIVAGSYDSTGKSITLTVDATQMKVLDPKLPTKRRDSVQENMAGPKVLDVGTYHTISFVSTKIDDSDPSLWTITGNLTLHGQTHPITFQARRLDAAHFSGSATVRQTAFGISPIRIAGGAVSVKDDVNVEFQIALSP